jgi:hypothetical protein
MKNVMLNAIPKSSFLRMVTEATNVFREIHANGVLVTKMKTSSVASGSGKYDCVKKLIADSSMDAIEKAAVLMLLKSADKGTKKVETPVSRRPNVEELAKQFLTFVPYAAVVPLRNRNHHAYNIGEAVIMVHGDDGANKEMFGMDKRGCIINRSASAADGLSHLPRLRKSLRPATNYEICQLVDRLYS